MSGLFVPLDVEYPSDDEFIEAGYVAELLYIRALCFAKRKQTDGSITRSQLPSVALGIPAAKKHAQKLVDVGLWTTTDDGWNIPAYLKRNPSKEEIETTKALAKEAGERGNHERWHIGEDGKPSSKCRLCRADRIGKTSGNPIGSPMGGSNRGRSPVPDTDPVPHPEPYPDPVPDTDPSDSRRPTGSTGGTTNGRTTTGDSQQRINVVLGLLAEHQIRNAGITPISDEKYRASVINKLLAQHGPRIREFVNSRPDTNPETCAEALKKEIA